MIYLYQFPSLWHLPNTSPFCMKLEVYLRLAKIPYKTKSVMDPRRSPKGKLPFIKDEGTMVADSGFIIDYLKKEYGDTLDQQLTPKQQMESLLLQRTLDEHLYWVMIYSRWVEKSGWEITERDFFQGIPRYLKFFLPTLIRRQMIKQLHAQGMGRHKREEIYELGNRDVLAIAQFIGEKSFAHGEQPSSIDASIYAFLANILLTPIESPLKSYALSIPALSAYCDRMKKMIAN